jgi:hypothetical protein
MALRLAILFVLLFFSTYANAQDDGQKKSSKSMPSNYLDEVSLKTDGISQKLTSKTNKALTRMQKHEEKLRRKLYKIDSIAANNLFSNTLNRYDEFQKKLNDKADKLTAAGLNNYLPYMDSLKTVLKFLEKDGNPLISQNRELQEKLTTAMKNVNELDNKLAQLKSIQQYLRERKQYLKEQLEKYGLGKYLKKLNKEVYYYSQLLSEYKSILSDPKRIEEKALALLRGLPAFKRFMERNSQLASIFGIPSMNAGAVPATLVGVQTRASVQQYIQANVVGASNPQQFIQQQIQTANKQLSQLKNNLPIFDKYGNAVEIPDFKVNTEKHKPFVKRLELGANVQFGKINRLLPTTGDFALSLGYKLNGSGIVGVGSSYRVGFGSGIQNIQFTHQGFGLRSFIDWKIKGGFYVSGGYEKNYLPALQIPYAPVDFSEWQESGLIGLSKKYRINKKMKGSMNLLFDFLSYKNIPRSQPILFRVGWNF